MSSIGGGDKSAAKLIYRCYSRKEKVDEHQVYFERLRRGDELGVHRPRSEAKQKRDRRRESEKTAGSKWFDMPAFPRSASENKPGKGKGKGNKYPSNNGPTAEEMTREIQAIRLRNAMDPKRFYRGGNGAGGKGMPAFAQMGRIISSNMEPASTLSRSERGRNVIDELVKDTQTAAYTKRKFSEVSEEIAEQGAGLGNDTDPLCSNKRGQTLDGAVTLPNAEATMLGKGSGGSPFPSGRTDVRF